MSRYNYHRNLVRDGMHPDALKVPEHVRADLLAEAQDREFTALAEKVSTAFWGADEVETMSDGGYEAGETMRGVFGGITRSGLRVRLVLEVE